MEVFKQVIFLLHKSVRKKNQAEYHWSSYQKELFSRITGNYLKNCNEFVNLAAECHKSAKCYADKARTNPNNNKSRR